MSGANAPQCHDRTAVDSGRRRFFFFMAALRNRTQPHVATLAAYGTTIRTCVGVGVGVDPAMRGRRGWSRVLWIAYNIQISELLVEHRIALAVLLSHRIEYGLIELTWRVIICK